MDSDSEGDVPPLLGPDGKALPIAPPVARKKETVAPAEKKSAAAASPNQQPSSAARPTSAPAQPPKPGANLKPSSGLRKGFLSGGGGSSSSSRTSGGSVSGGEKPASSSSASSSSAAATGIDVPFVRAAADAKDKSLQLPEVQSKIAAEQAEAAKMGNGKGGPSWMTPELLKKIASKPILRKAFTDPKCQAAMAEMQTDPKAAMEKYKDVPEMVEFLQTFMKLMGEHFTALAEKEDAERAASEEASKMMAPSKAQTPEEKKAQEVADKALANEDVRKILAEPQIQQLLQNMQLGKSFELQKEAARDPTIVGKLQKLAKAGLIGMQWQP